MILLENWATRDTQRTRMGSCSYLTNARLLPSLDLTFPEIERVGLGGFYASSNWNILSAYGKKESSKTKMLGTSLQNEDKVSWKLCCKSWLK